MTASPPLTTYLSAIRRRAAVASFLGAAAIAAVSTCAWAPQACADVYRFVDAEGVVHLADRPLGPGYRLILRSRRTAETGRVSYRPTNRYRFEKLIVTAARKHRLDGALIHAVVQVESDYDPSAISKAGAVGLMQLMPATARRYGVWDRENPQQNIDGGARYLSDLLEQFRSVPLALAAYNAGEKSVSNYGNRIPPYPETRSYVRKVLEQYRSLRRSQ